MLTAPAFGRHIAFGARARRCIDGRRFYARGRRGGSGRDANGSAHGKKGEDGGEGRQAGAPKSMESAKRAGPRPLIEQLFPERYAAQGAHGDEAREVPPIPTQHPPPAPESPWISPEGGKRPSRSEMLRRAMEARPPDTAVLVLRNAGNTLTEEDFRRVIPQGKHLEGWTLEQGDILRVIPGRDLETLEHAGYYFLLFSSPLSAFTYQGHVSRIHRMVAANSPSSLLSPIAPPPGYMLEGMDAHDAINSFTLIPPDQSIQLRHLQPPFSPAVQSIVKHGGYEALMRRKGRMPHEARIVLEGPQLHLPTIRRILRESGRDRGLPWSGGESELPKLAQWEPISPDDMPSPASKKRSAMVWENKTAGGAYKSQYPPNNISPSSQHASGDGPVDDTDLKRRTPRPVYIAGFASEQALHSFIHFWHGRPMTWGGAGNAGGEEEGDLPPITHVEKLW